MHSRALDLQLRQYRRLTPVVSPSASAVDRGPHAHRHDFYRRPGLGLHACGAQVRGKQPPQPFKTAMYRFDHRPVSFECRERLIVCVWSRGYAQLVLADHPKEVALITECVALVGILYLYVKERAARIESVSSNVCLLVITCLSRV